jgi:uncharacterized membrane protein (DUF4010 family)
MLGYSELTIGLGVVTAAVLAYKQPLHGFVDKLGWDDVYAGLRLLIATFIALPLLPNQPIDPWGALNPYKLWLLVILMSSLSLVGYVLTRLLEPSRGVALTRLTGGLVSSTAVTLSFSRDARDHPQMTNALAWAVMFLRVPVLVAVVNRALLSQLLIPFVVMAVVVAAFAALLYFRDGSVKRGKATGHLEVENPFSLTAAAKFAALSSVTAAKKQATSATRRKPPLRRRPAARRLRPESARANKAAPAVARFRLPAIPRHTSRAISGQGRACSAARAGSCRRVSPLQKLPRNINALP